MLYMTKQAKNNFGYEKIDIFMEYIPDERKVIEKTFEVNDVSKLERFQKTSDEAFIYKIWEYEDMVDMFTQSEIKQGFCYRSNRI